MRTTVTVQDAEGKLGDLIDRAARGEEVVIARSDETRARLVPLVVKRRAPRELGRYRGLVETSEDFDAPLPEAFWLGPVS